MHVTRKALEFLGLLLASQLGAAQRFSEYDIEVMSYWNTRPARIVSDVELQDRVMMLKLAQASPALAHQFPFAASITLHNIHTCGGALIGPRAVLTAAHCVTDISDGSIKAPEAMSVRVGSIVRGEGPEYLVDQIVVPEVYSLNSSFLGDIALVELAQAVSTQPATLPSESVVEPVAVMSSASESDNVFVSDAASLAPVPAPSTSISSTTEETEAALPLTAIGWGYTSEVSTLSTSLMEALLTPFSDGDCEAFHQAKGLGEKPVDHFCAGDASGADTCRGDSGGPLLKGDFEIVGITSYGPSDSKCGSADGSSTGVYTSSRFWRPWILDSLALYNMGGDSKPSRLVTPDFFTCWAGEYGHQVTSRQLTPSVGECAEQCRGDALCLSFQWEFGTSQCSLSLTPAIPKETGEGLCHTGEVTRDD